MGNTNQTDSKQPGCANNPVVVILGTIAAFTTIIVFVFGFGNLPEIIRWLTGQGILSSRPYDDFNDSKYDGNYNSNLWEYDGTTHVTVKQQNGILSISTNDKGSPGANNALHPILPKSWKLPEFNIMESRLMLRGERKGQKGMIKMQAVLEVENQWFFIECMLQNKADNHASFLCDFANDEYGESNNYQYEYETTPIDVGYNEWHTARFEINPDSVEIRYYLDGKIIGSFIPKDTNLLRNAVVYPQIGSWTDPGENFIGYFDNILLGK